MEFTLIQTNYKSSNQNSKLTWVQRLVALLMQVFNYILIAEKTQAAACSQLTHSTQVTF